jgi:hypothetical protein
MGARRVPHQVSRAAAALIVALACACRSRDPDRDRDTGSITVHTSSASAWSVVRAESDAVLRLGDVYVYISTEPPAGLSLGDARGPRSGLISGAFAPLVAAPESNRAYHVEVETRGDRLRARFDAPGSERNAAIAVAAPQAGRVQLHLHGAVQVLLPADRTDVRAIYKNAPSAAYTITAGGGAKHRAPKADRIEVTTNKLGTVVLETSCERPKIIEPIARGSTSVFVLAPGQAPRADDPMFSAGAVETDPCKTTETSTLSLPWPGA